MKFIEHSSRKVLGLTSVELALFSSLLVMCLLIVVDTMSGRNVGSYEQVKMAKLQAQQDLMTSRANPNN